MREIIVGKVYMHFKGAFYKVIAIGYHTETNEKLVVYEGLGDKKIWVRPYEMFNSKVDKDKYPDVEQEYRFEVAKLKRR